MLSHLKTRQLPPLSWHAARPWRWGRWPTVPSPSRIACSCFGKAGLIGVGIRVTVPLMHLARIRTLLCWGKDNENGLPAQPPWLSFLPSSSPFILPSVFQPLPLFLETEKYWGHASKWVGEQVGRQLASLYSFGLLACQASQDNWWGTGLPHPHVVTGRRSPSCWGESTSGHVWTCPSICPSAASTGGSHTINAKAGPAVQSFVSRIWAFVQTKEQGTESKF